MQVSYKFLKCLFINLCYFRIYFQTYLATTIHSSGSNMYDNKPFRCQDIAGRVYSSTYILPKNLRKLKNKI